MCPKAAGMYLLGLSIYTLVRGGLRTYNSERQGGLRTGLPQPFCVTPSEYLCPCAWQPQTFEVCPKLVALHPQIIVVLECGCLRTHHSEHRVTTTFEVCPKPVALRPQIIVVLERRCLRTYHSERRGTTTFEVCPKPVALRPQNICVLVRGSPRTHHSERRR